MNDVEKSSFTKSETDDLRLLTLQYEYIARQIDREDHLVNNRMGWTLQINGFLFAALAFAGNDMPPVLTHFFRVALPLIAFAITFSGLIGIHAAGRQLHYLKSLWSQEQFPDWPRPFGEPDVHRLGHFASRGSLWALILAWAVFLLYVLSTPIAAR